MVRLPQDISRPLLANKRPDRERADNQHGKRKAGKPGFR